MDAIRLTPKQLADRLVVKEATLTDWRYKKIGPAYVKQGHLVRYPLEEVEAWEVSHLVGNGKGPGAGPGPSADATTPEGDVDREE